MEPTSQNNLEMETASFSTEPDYQFAPLAKEDIEFYCFVNCQFAYLKGVAFSLLSSRLRLILYVNKYYKHFTEM